MTAETAPHPEEQVRAQIGHQELARYGIVLAAVMHMLLHDRRFHAAVMVCAVEPGLSGPAAWSLSAGASFAGAGSGKGFGAGG